MLHGHDLTLPHDVEGLRRSIAMLDTGARVFTRAEALAVLDALAAAAHAAGPRRS